jgi:hypothetical protein
VAASLLVASASAAFAGVSTIARPAVPDSSAIVQSRVDDSAPYNWQLRSDTRIGRGNRDSNWQNYNGNRRGYYNRRDYSNGRDYWRHRRYESDNWDRYRYRPRRSNGFYFNFGVGPRW